MIGYKKYFPFKGSLGRHTPYFCNFNYSSTKVSAANSSVMLIAQYLNYATFTAIKPPKIGPEFAKAIQYIRAALEPVLRNMKSNQSLSILDALIIKPSFPSPHDRLVLKDVIDVQCSDIGYLMELAKKPHFVRLGNIIDTESFRPLALANVNSKSSIDLEPENVWSISNDGQNHRYTSFSQKH